MKKLFIFFTLFLTCLLTSCDILDELTCEHSYTVTKVEASTCSKAGYEIKTCDKCGKEKKSTLKLLDHNYETNIIKPTCSSYGYTLNTCKECGHKKETDKVDPIPHNFNETVNEATCLDKGYTVYTCSVCGHSENGNYVAELGHELGDWETIKEPTDVSDGIKVRSCKRCDYSENEYIASTSYIDLTYVKESFDHTLTYDCKNFEELSYLFNLAIINLAPTLTCNVYDISDFNSLLDSLVDNCDVPFSCGINANLKGNELVITLTYNGEPIYKTPNVAYIQQASLNYNPTTNKRSDTFDEFKINNSLYTFNVTTSEQLHYALERGVKPIIKKDSTTEVIYNKAKEVLRQIINDDMTDLEKVKAIHDWIVMNVVYDEDLLSKVYLNPDDLNKYIGFHLEGVFLDNKAVCEGISKAVTVMCNIEGIPCVTVEGYQAENPNGVGHAWNKVYIDGKWYILDVTSDGTIIRGEYEVLSYKYFLINESEYSKKYTAKTRTNIVCNDIINVYESMTFAYNNNMYDYVIESQEELDILVSYLYSSQTNNCTVEFKLSFNYGDSILDEIATSFRTNKISTAYSYVDNGSIFMLIRK